MSGVWQRFATNRTISPQVIQAERVINRFFARRGYGGEVWTTVHSIQVVENEGNIEMRVEQVYRQSLQMAHFVANRCHIPEGNPPGKLADPRAGQRAAGRP